ncbi:MAG: sugar ABC transporter permease, partial [Planctomycetaceae bacterium]
MNRLLRRQRELTLNQRDALWGYLFVALPIIGFVVFAAGPILASVILSFAEWDLLRDPKWVGLDNWRQLLTINITEVPQEIDEATGEPLFLCARQKVPESQVAELEGTIDPTTGTKVTCEPRYMRERDVLPEGYRTALELNLSSRHYLIGSRDPLFWEGLYNT